MVIILQYCGPVEHLGLIHNTAALGTSGSPNSDVNTAALGTSGTPSSDYNTAALGTSGTPSSDL